MALPTVVDWIKATNQEIGTSQDLEKNDTNDVYADGYTITYNLDGGTIFYGNPTNYNLFTETFTLNNPTKQGYDFIGWTNDTITEPTLTVTISKGSSGDVEFTANYIKAIESPVVSLTIDYPNIVTSWQAIENATSYDVYLDNEKVATTDKLIYEYKVLRGNPIGTHTINVVAHGLSLVFSNEVDSEFSNTCTFNILDTPVVDNVKVDSDNNDTISWTLVDNATSYVIEFANGTITTTNTSINVADYVDLLANEYNQNIYVTAIGVDSISYSSTVYYRNNRALITETINVPYVITIDYVEYSEDGDVVDIADGLDEGVKVADYAVTLTNGDKHFSMTQSQYLSTRTNGYKMYYKVSELQSLASAMSFEDCVFAYEYISTLFEYLDTNIKTDYTTYGNSAYNVDLGANSDFSGLFKITTSERTNFVEHILFAFQINTFETI